MPGTVCAKHPLGRAGKRFLAPFPHGRGIARREIVAAAALGLSVLALAVPAVWVSKLRMSAQSAAVPLVRPSTSSRRASPEPFEGLVRRSAPRHGGIPSSTTLRSSSLRSTREPLLTEEVRRLRGEVIRLQDERRRLERELSSAVELRERAASSEVDLGRFIEAFVVGRSVNWQEQSFLVDRGREDGVALRAGCLHGGAVVGVVVEVGPHVARVACVSEPDVRVAVRTLHTRRSGLAVGTGGACELRYIPRWASGGPPGPVPPAGRRRPAGPGEGGPVRGEPVVTSGRLGFFPPGFLLGWITSIGYPRDSLHLSVAVRPEIGEAPDGRVWVLRPTRREVE